jgi:outer membrane immunogenic protein
VLVKRICAFLIAVCAVACMARAAVAIDLNASVPVTPAPPPKPAWAGFYLKNNSGSGTDSNPWATLGNTTGFATPSSTASPINESFGYNFQSGNFVFGLDGSLAAANFDGKFTSPNFTPGPWTPNMNWSGNVTGRLGYSVGQWLPYVKGGFAAAETGSPLQGSGIGSFTQGSDLAGWTAGLGVEYQFSPKLSLGLEYLYTDLSSGAAGANNGLGAPLTGSPEVYSTAIKTQSLLGRLNYKPGW